MNLRFVWILIFSVILLSIQKSKADFNDEDYNLSHEDDNLITKEAQESSNEQNQPDLLCEKGGLCSCHRAQENVLNCSRASLKDGLPLDTTFLKISKKNKDFSNLTTQIVYLSHNEIEVLRKNRILPGQEENVLVLDLSYNRIEDVQKNSLDKFTRLNKLKLTHNRLRYEEISIDWLTVSLGNSLHQLYLDFNYIKDLDDGIFDNLKSLTKLVLDGNLGLKLTSNTFGSGLKNLKTLSLDMCGFETLEEDLFKNLPSLTQLSLSGNPFTTIPKALNSIPLLSIIVMIDTNLNEIPKYAFKSNPELTSIYFRKMPHLYNVNDCAFCKLNQLQLVDLSFSKHLYTINKNAFGGSSNKERLPDNFQTLLVSNCNLTSIPEELLNWEQLSKLGLGANPLDCSCDFSWLIKNRKIQHFVGSSEPTCATPANYNNIPVRKLLNTLDCGDYLPPQPEVATTSNNFLLMFVVMGLCGAILIVAFTYARHRGAVPHYLGSTLSVQPRTNPTDQLCYTNLNGAGVINAVNEFDDGEQNRLQHDFNHPEFV